MATCALPPAPPSISPEFRPAFESDPLTFTCDKCAAFHERELVGERLEEGEEGVEDGCD